MENKQEITETMKDFEDIPMKLNILRGIYSYGFENPSKVQRKAIPIFINEKENVDMIVQSEPGTGKTLVYTTALLQKIDEKSDEVQVLIIVPTRELARQIFRVLRALGVYTSVRIHVNVGGTSVRDDRRKIKSDKPHVIVGTPGRLLHNISESAFDVSQIKMLILDEGDCLFLTHNKSVTYDLFRYLPKGMQIGLFSSSITHETIQICEKFMNNPVKILLEEIPEFEVYEDTKGIENLGNYGSFLSVGSLTNIFLFLDVSSLPSCSSTCQLFQRIIQSHYFWKNYSTNSFPEREFDDSDRFNYKSQYFIETHPNTVRPRNIDLYYVDVVDEKTKYESLVELIKRGIRTVVYLSTKKRAAYLFQKLCRDEQSFQSNTPFGKFTSDVYDRENVLKEFRCGATRVLLVCKGFGRGIDIHHIAMVVNYDVPDGGYDSFYRRACLCGRFGRKGVCVTLVEGEEEKLKLLSWEKRCLKKIGKCPEEFEL